MNELVCAMLFGFGLAALVHKVRSIIEERRKRRAIRQWTYKP